MSATGYATPEEAEQAFYDAFQRADLDAMMNVWAEREFIECIHPMAERVRGRTAIANSWRHIFSADTQVQIRLSGIHRTRDSLLAIHVLYEHLDIPGDRGRPPTMIATNIYQLIEGSWHMVLHHASPVPDSDAGALKNAPDTPRRKRNLH